MTTCACNRELQETLVVVAYPEFLMAIWVAVGPQHWFWAGAVMVLRDARKRKMG